METGGGREGGRGDMAGRSAISLQNIPFARCRFLWHSSCSIQLGMHQPVGWFGWIRLGWVRNFHVYGRFGSVYGRLRRKVSHGLINCYVLRWVGLGWVGWG